MTPFQPFGEALMNSGPDASDNLQMTSEQSHDEELIFDIEIDPPGTRAISEPQSPGPLLTNLDPFIVEVESPQPATPEEPAAAIMEESTVESVPRHPAHEFGRDVQMIEMTVDVEPSGILAFRVESLAENQHVVVGGPHVEPEQSEPEPPTLALTLNPFSGCVIWGLDITEINTPAGDPREERFTSDLPDFTLDYEYHGNSVEAVQEQEAEQDPSNEPWEDESSRALFPLDLDTLSRERKEDIFKLLLARTFADLAMVGCYNLTHVFIESAGWKLAAQMGLTNLKFSERWVNNWKEEFLGDRLALSYGWTVDRILDKMVDEDYEPVLKRTIYLSGHRSYPNRIFEASRVLAAQHPPIESLIQPDVVTVLTIGTLCIKHSARLRPRAACGAPLKTTNSRKRSRPIAIPVADPVTEPPVASPVLPEYPSSRPPVKKSGNRRMSIRAEFEQLNANYEQNPPNIELRPAEVRPPPVVNPETILVQLFRANLAKRFTAAEMTALLAEPMEMPLYDPEEFFPMGEYESLFEVDEDETKVGAVGRQRQDSGVFEDAYSTPLPSSSSSSPLGSLSPGTSGQLSSGQNSPASEDERTPYKSLMRGGSSSVPRSAPIRITA